MARNADVNALAKDRTSPLHLAAFNGCKDCTEMLIKHGAKVNLKDNDGWNPLHCAALGGSAKCVEFLIKHDADVEAETSLDAIDQDRGKRKAGQRVDSSK